MTAPSWFETLRLFLGRLVTPVGRWQQASRNWQPPEPPDPALLAETLVLPLQGVAAETLDLGEVLPEAEQLVATPDAELQQRVRQHLQTLSLALLGTDAGLLRQLSDIAFEAATHRTLLGVHDRCDVSAVSVLAALALVNYARAWVHFQSPQPPPLEAGVLRTIAQPLNWILELNTPCRPGDFWFLDLAARSVCRGRPPLPAAGPPSLPGAASPLDAPAAGPSSAEELARFAAPRFLAVSLLYKLLEAGHTPAWVLQQGGYQSWPGLRELLTDPGIESLRTLVAADLARALATDRSGLTSAALLRFLAALLALDGEELQVKASLLIANLWWELLGLDEQLLGKLYQHPQMAATFGAAVRAVAQPLDRFAGFPEACSRLAETRQLLRANEQYRACEELAAGPPGPFPSPTPERST